MFRIFKWLYIIAFLFFVKLAVELYFNVLISQKYNAFSETDIEFIKNMIVYTIILNISSLVVLFYRKKNL
jgi:heme/copper-type cytochrome/quinol oxidase subunit 3